MFYLENDDDTNTGSESGGTSGDAGTGDEDTAM
jgi:hypothetical protein